MRSAKKSGTEPAEQDPVVDRQVVEIARGPGDETGDAMATAAHAAPSDVSGQHGALAASGHPTEANAPAPVADPAGPPQDAPPTGEED